jgi:hypothetical protein
MQSGGSMTGVSVDDAVTSLPDGRSNGTAAPSSLDDRRSAIADLGEALRNLVEFATATEVPTADLRRAADQIRQAGALLAEHQRTRTQLSSADDLRGDVRMYNPVGGAGSGIAPPLLVELREGMAIGTCTLGLAFEGPPTYAHGGISALLMDQMLGYAIVGAGHPGMTVNLVTDYRAPVPLKTPLRLTAEVTGVDGRKVTARGTIATAADPGTPLVEATGLFLALAPEQAQHLFGAILDPHPAVAHD